MLDKFALGSAQFGSNYGIANKTGKPAQEEVNRIIATAVSSGIKNIDTAQAYRSEEAIGIALHGIDRSNLRISTKLSPKILENINSEQEAISNVDQCVENSLKALNTDYIDIFMLHRWSHFSEQKGIAWQRLLFWKNKGVINKLGASLVSVSETIEALKEPAVQFIQIPFNILDWRFRSQDIREAIEKRPDVTIQTRSAFLQGTLISPAQIWPHNSGVDANSIIGQLDKLTQDFKRNNRADLCIAYLRSLDWIDNIVIGMETLVQLQYNIDLFNTPILTKEQISVIESSFINAPEELLNPSLWKRI